MKVTEKLMNEFGFNASEPFICNANEVHDLSRTDSAKEGTNTPYSCWVFHEYMNKEGNPVTVKLEIMVAWASKDRTEAEVRRYGKLYYEFDANEDGKTDKDGIPYKPGMRWVFKVTKSHKVPTDPEEATEE